MRFLCFLFLLAFGGVVALFAYQNQNAVTLDMFGRSITTTVPILLGVTYGLGMLSGWTVVGMLRRSVARVMEPGRQERGSTAR
jgi:hypothetical protein